MKEYKKTDIIKQIEQGKIYPVYLLYGEEDFLIHETLDRMIELLLNANTRDFNLNIFDGVDASVPEILTLAETYPIMSSHRLIIVKNLTLFKKEKSPSKAEILRKAVDAYDAGNEKKAVSLSIKALQIQDEESISDEIGKFIDEFKDELDADELDFLSNLPNLISGADPSTSRAGPERSEGMTSLQFESGGNEMEYLLEWLDGDLPLSNIVVFTVNGLVDERNRLVKAIEKVGIVVDFSVKQDEVYKWISNKLREYNKRISSGASRLLIDRAGDNIGLISEELEKIVAYVGEKQQIEIDDIKQVVTLSRDESIFTFTDAIAIRNIPLALLSLHRLLNDGEPPIYINAMIARQVRLMLQAKLLVKQEIIKHSAARMRYNDFRNYFSKLPSSASQQLPKSKQHNILKQNPYTAFKILQSINRFSTDELIKGMEILLQADFQLKSSVSSPKAILEQVIFDLCEKPNIRRKRL